MTEIRTDRDLTARRMMERFSLEMTPKETTRLPALAGLLPQGTRVYITSLPGAPWSDTVEAARRAIAHGLVPVPHLAARAVVDPTHLRRMLAALTDLGIDEVLLVAGSRAEPAGEFQDSPQVLRSGLLEEARITRVGLCGHPEGNREIGDAGLRRALAEKNAAARVLDLDLYLVTQFCFSPEPVLDWERRIRGEGNMLPVVVGLPGVTSPAKLLRFGLSCGVGPSLQVLRKQFGNVARLAAAPVHRPDRTLRAVIEAAAEPGSLFRGIHFFPFGSVAATARWALMLQDGRDGSPDTAEDSA